MTLYEPSGLGQLSIGKDIPALGPFRNFKPNLVGPIGGKFKGALRIARYLTSGSRGAGILAGTAIGTGVGLSGNQKVRSVPNYKALRGKNKRFNLIRSRKQQHRCRCNRSRCC